MKTLIVTLGGTLTVGDLLVLEYKHPTRGGNSAVKALVREPKDEIITDPVTKAKTVKTTGETIESLVRQLVDDINGMRSWLADFRAVVRDSNPKSLVIRVPDLVEDVIFNGFVEGAATETMELELI
jgi:hypothetical protein